MQSTAKIIPQEQKMCTASVKSQSRLAVNGGHGEGKVVY